MGKQLYQQEQKKLSSQVQKPDNTQKNFQLQVREKKLNQNTDKEFMKMLRRPRSKRKMKLLQQIDLPSMGDEIIMRRMREEGGQSDITSSTSEDMVAYLARIQTEFKEMVQKEIEEEKRIEEERRLEEQRLEEERNNRLQLTLTECFIEGCEVHTLGATGDWSTVVHYKANEIPLQLAKAYQIYKNLSKCYAVEIYPNRMVALTSDGEVIKIIEA